MVKQKNFSREQDTIIVEDLTPIEIAEFLKQAVEFFNLAMFQAEDELEWVKRPQLSNVCDKLNWVMHQHET